MTITMPGMPRSYHTTQLRNIRHKKWVPPNKDVRREPIRSVANQEAMHSSEVQGATRRMHVTNTKPIGHRRNLVRERKFS